MKFTSDIDIDFADRSKILALINHTPASIMDTSNKVAPHNTGVYVTAIPTDPITNRASIDYKQAEQRGYIKLDFLNVNVYASVQDEQHLIRLMHTVPDWNKLYDKEFCQQLVHIGNHYDTLIKFPEPVNTIARLAMFLAVIRPAKRHLIGKPWSEVSKTIWESDPNGGYAFKKSHSVSYSHLVVAHMNLLSKVM
jgi:hypothetical protein